jgi:transcriptional regulator GlxA family with amidase domain
MLIEEDYGPHVALSVRQELVTGLVERKPEIVTRPVFHTHPTHRFGELVAWLLRNLDQDTSVEAMARRACMSPRHFTRAFKSVFGSAPGEFVNNLRLNEARRRLSTRGKTVRAIGASVGFANSTAFRRAFEQRFGQKPNNCCESTEPSRAAKFPKQQEQLTSRAA